MVAVSQAFDDFLQNLELTDAQQKKASDQQNELRDRIRKHLGGVVRDVLVGSYARKTAIRPLNDIDVFLELDLQVHGYRRSQEPRHLLEDVLQALRNSYPAAGPQLPGPKTRIQGRSAKIEFTGTGIGYDVIPAFLMPPDRSRPVRGDVYEIPDRNQQTWIKTNPELHKQKCVAANDRAGGALRDPLVS
jgi:predicted nucleotidyltransferase